MLVALAAGILVVTLGTGALNSLNVFFVTHNLHVTAKGYGTALSPLLLSVIPQEMIGR